ncbi:recombination regulator RecX [Rhizobium sp. SL42]|uniref:recombination regulator RecX n=1 Tax=Rhizobium sp. SL42 TaxID=2806346 RepID=UPI001F19DE65|nr:recombination regulator RecX [Rhizobium sp. SL42]UJW77446.1 recombination regulator RecX [Rhizobium sp. SL42]
MDAVTSAADETEVPTARMLAWARNSAAYRLAKRMMTERELSDAIMRKARQKFEGISQAQVEALGSFAITFGRNMKVLDDQAYAEIRSNSAARSGKSKRAIARKLQEKGVDREIVATVLGEADDLRAAVVLARKRAFGPFRKTEADEKQRTKEFASFARNGFGFELGRRIMQMDLDEAEQILYGDP